MAGLVAVGIGIALFAPKLVSSALPLLLLAACPLSMLLMMVAMGNMGRGSAASTPRQLKGMPAHTALSREEQLALLREQFQSLQSQQANIASQINILEQAELQSTLSRSRSDAVDRL